MSPTILVAGIGNIFLGDDAFGSEVARRLLLQTWPAGVRVEDFGIRGFDLTFALMDRYDAVILVDATPRGGLPGTLYTIEPDLSELDQLAAGGATIEPHAMNPLNVLRAAKSMGADFGEVLLIGCEPSPEYMDPDGPGHMGLSEPVGRVMDQAVNLVNEMVAQLIVNRSQNQTATGGI
jgi:hydrogenase maturation protease